MLRYRSYCKKTRFLIDQKHCSHFNESQEHLNEKMQYRGLCMSSATLKSRLCAYRPRWKMDLLKKGQTWQSYSDAVTAVCKYCEVKFGFFVRCLTSIRTQSSARKMDLFENLVFLLDCQCLKISNCFSQYAHRNRSISTYTVDSTVAEYRKSSNRSRLASCNFWRTHGMAHTSFSLSAHYCC